MRKPFNLVYRKGKYSQLVELGRQTCWQSTSSPSSLGPCGLKHSFWPPWIHGSCLGHSRSWGKSEWGLHSFPQTTQKTPGYGLGQLYLGTSHPGTGPTEGDGQSGKVGRNYIQHRLFKMRTHLSWHSHHNRLTLPFVQFVEPGNTDANQLLDCQEAGDSIMSMFYPPVAKFAIAHCVTNNHKQLIVWVYLAISHLLTSSPLLGMKPMPLWGSLLAKVLRKWTYGASSVISK